MNAENKDYKMKNLVKNNKLIAKFMDIQVTDFQWRDWKTLVLGDENDAMDFANLVYYNPESNWNQLMNTVERIESMGYSILINMNFCRIVINNEYDHEECFEWEGKEKKIEAVYNAVVKFIKWYNKTIKL